MSLPITDWPQHAPDLGIAGLRLRPLHDADTADWYAYLNDDAVTRHTSWQLDGPEILVRLIRGYADPAATHSVRLAIAGPDDRLIGTIGLNEISLPNRRAEIAYDLAPVHWRQGIATQASRLSPTGPCRRWAWPACRPRCWIPTRPRPACWNVAAFIAKGCCTTIAWCAANRAISGSTPASGRPPSWARNAARKFQYGPYEESMTSALIVIDVQRALFETTPAPADADAVLARINTLTDRARACGAPVIYVQHEAPGSPMDYGLPAWQLDTRLQPADGDIRVRKTTPDSFLRTDLADVLAEAGVTRLVVCGYASEFCVDTTVRRAAALGFPVTLAADAHTTQDKPHAPGAQIRAHHNATLSSIASFGVKIAAIPAADIVFGGPAAA